jgi:hypothetical protein
MSCKTLPLLFINLGGGQFEIRLDKYWEHKDVKFEYKASIQNKENTGNHTEISCITEEVEVDIVAESLYYS